jgi:hypothetical protein
MWPFTKRQKSEELDNKRLKAFGELAVISSLCIGPDRIPVMHGKRDTPNNVSDSGWILSSGEEAPEFLADSSNYKLVPLERMIAAEPTLAPLRDMPVGTEITRKLVTEPWRYIAGVKVTDEDGRIVGVVR